MKTIAIIQFALLMLLAGCDTESATEPAPQKTAEPRAATPSTRSADAVRRPRVVFLGDSLTAGLGVDRDQAYPAIVTGMLAKQGIEIDAVNAGVSGDTTAGGLRRLDWLLKQKPDVLVVGLGGNDGLRGIDLRDSENNLRQIITRARDAGTRVLLLGMLIPPNYGPDYTRQFAQIYPKLAEELDVPLVPFLLENVGGEAQYNQRDGIHPTPEGHQIVAKNVAPHLREVVEQLREN